MDLKDIYTLSEIIKNKIDKKELSDDTKYDMEITVQVEGSTYYGIDKEFYYLTHGNSYDGFIHSEKLVKATVNDVKFNIIPKESEIGEK